MKMYNMYTFDRTEQKLVITIDLEINATQTA
jgi:hypothetical protein